MKKLFVSMLAIAALVSCSKDDAQGPALDSANKTVSITIKNGAAATRAALDGTSAGITAPAEGKHGDELASANATELFVLFAAGDEIKKILPLSSTSQTDDNHTNISGEYAVGVTSENAEGVVYTWHNVPWNITNIAVVRTDATLDPTYYGVNATITSVDAFEELAKNEAANLDRKLSEIVLFGEDALTDTGRTHEVNEITYHYWRADVEVAPQFARFEINNIECEDLGALNADGLNNTYGFDEMDVLSLSWTSSDNKTYQIEVAEDATIGRLYGQYVPTTTPTADQNTYAGTEDRAAAAADDVQPADGNVWSWNVLPTSWTGMKVGLWAYAYDYALADAGRDLTLNVVGLNGESGEYEFAKGNIYKLNLKFEEGNVKDQDALCVEVTVDIQPWTIVNDLNPVFGN